MSSDFNLNVRSWFLGNVPVKPQCPSALPPLHHTANVLLVISIDFANDQLSPIVWLYYLKDVAYINYNWFDQLTMTSA